MKKTLLSMMLVAIALSSISMSMSAQVVHAACGATDSPNGATDSSCDTTTVPSLTNPLKGVNSIGDLFGKIIQVVIDISYAVVAFFLILSGFKFVAAQGSESKLSEAKETFKYTIIGAFLVVGAQVIYSVIQNIITSLNKTS